MENAMNCSSLPDNQTADFIERFFPFTYNQILDNDSGCYDFVNHEYVIWHRSLAEALPLSVQQYGYDSIPNLYTILDTSSLDSAGISRTAEQTFLGNKGRGALIGIVDTGIDYTHPVFRNLDGTTRIAGIWDQTIQDGDPPEGFLYGTEYTEERINAALHSESPQELISSEDTDGHGTFVASVAAGSAESSGQFLGAAPEAVIAMVKLKPAKKYLKEFFAVAEDAHCYQENDILAGLRYLNELARRREMPLVICMAIGTSFGGHNGDSLLAGVLDGYALLRNRCVVTGTGNEAAQRHHYYGTFTEAQNIRTAEIRVGEGVKGFVTELWSTLPNIVTVSITSPSGERTGQIPVRLGYLLILYLLLNGQLLRWSTDFCRRIAMHSWCLSGCRKQYRESGK